MNATIFHSTEPPWFERVKALKPGGRVRLSDGQLVSYNGKGWHLYDFREKQSEVYEPELTMGEKLALALASRTAEAEASASAELPTTGAMYHPKDWPLEARVWFYKAGINNDNIRDLGAFWSPAMRRLVLPYRTVSGEQAWIARDVTWKKGSPGTKYLFPAGVKRGGGAVFRRDLSGPRAGYVITEDALSAYRAARDTDLSAIAAQGTSLDRDTVTLIATLALKRSVPVFVWLDPDYYGQRGAAKLRQQFGVLGIEVRNIVSERDPKLHEPHELREALEV